MFVISYDIKDDKVRTRFSKMLTRNGAIRLQYSYTKSTIQNAS